MATIDRRGITVDAAPSSASSSDPSAHLAIKTPVRVATTAAITLSGEQTIDGVAVVADDRVLVKDQSSAVENGIYLASSGNWTRATDFDGNTDVVKGTAVVVTDGTEHSQSIWSVSASDPITIDTTSITFIRLAKRGDDNLNPVDFGVVRGGGSATANSTAIATVIALASSTARSIVFPGGVFDFASPIALSVGVSMLGKYGDTTLRTTSATADLIDAAGFNVIDGFNFQSTATRTGGYWVDIAGSEVHVTNFRGSGTYNGFLVRDGAGSFRIQRGHLSAFAAGGNTINIGDGSGSAAQVGYITDLILAATVAGRPNAHIRLLNADSINLRGNQIIGAVYNLLADPTSNTKPVVSIKSEGDWFDQGTTSNIHIAPSSTGYVSRCTFSDGWLGAAGTDNVKIAASGTNEVEGIDFIGMENFGSSGDGFDIDGATVTKINIIAGNHAGNTSSAIKVNDATGVLVSGARIGPSGQFGANGVGVTLSGAADDIIISGCDLQGNTSPLSNTASGVDIIIRSCLPLANNTSISTAEVSALFAAANTWTGIQKFTNISTQFEYTDDAATGGPAVDYVRISASPAASDILGQFSFWGKDGAGTTVVYGRARATILDTSAGLHDGSWELMATINGTVTTLLTLGPDVTVRSGVATPAGGSTSARLLFGTTAGFGIYYGSGAPSVSAAQGSLYLRSDGSGTTTRLYVNTDGATTWTNFTSAT